MSGSGGPFDPASDTLSPNATNETETGCSPFDHRRELATVTITCAAISLVACLVVLFVVCGLKKCHVLSQRLILYLAVAAIIKCFSWVQVVQYDLVESTSLSGSTARFCGVAGYFLMVSGWFEASAVACLSTNLLLNMVLKKSRKWLELAYIMIIFILPFTIMWIPFVTGAYGKTGFYCWIRAQTDKCEVFPTGVALQFLMWYLPLLFTLTYLLLLYCRVMWLTSKHKKRWDGNSNPTAQRSKLRMKDVRQLIWYPLIYFLLYLVPLAAQLSLIIFTTPVYSLWFISAISQPLQGGFAAVAFALDTQTVRRLRRQNLTATVRGLTQSVVVEDYPTQHILEDQTYDQSQDSPSSSSTDAEEEEEEEQEEDEVDGSRVKYRKYL